MKNITHTLTIGNHYLLRLLDGSKTHEVRFNDRDYQVGDRLLFEKPKETTVFDPFPTNYNLFGKYYRFEITHIHSNLGLKDGYVVLSLKFIEENGVSSENA